VLHRDRDCTLEVQESNIYSWIQTDIYNQTSERVLVELLSQWSKECIV
jgi:hypothetical protein